MSSLKNKKLFLLDMDGTIYLDNDLFDGTLEFLDYVKSTGGRYIFMTNNSSKSVEKYIEKLASLGIKSSEDDFLTSTNATCIYLKKQTYKKIYAFGTTSFKEQLKKEGFNITDKLEDDIDCLCMGFDTELTFQKLEDVSRLLLTRESIPYIASNPDYAALFHMTVPGITIRALGLNCGMYDMVERAKAPRKGLALDYLGKEVSGDDPRFCVLDAIGSNYPPAFITTACHDFLREAAEPMYRFLVEKGIRTEWKCYGSEEDKGVGHVFHVNILLPDAITCNDDSAAFFRENIS